MNFPHITALRALATPAALAITCAVTAFLLIVRTSPLHAATADDAFVKDALTAWGFLSRSVNVSRVKSKAEGAVTVRSASGDILGVKGTIEVRSRGVEPFQVKMAFPRGKGPGAAALKELLGTDPMSILPAGIGDTFELDHVVIELAQKKPVAAKLVAKLGQWKPFGANGLIIKGLIASVTLFEPLGKRSLEARLSGDTRLPAGLAKYFGLKAVDLAVSGLIDTESKTFMLTVALSPTPLPLGDANALSLDGAHMRLGFDRGIPTLAVGGALGIKPAAGGPLNLRAEVALKLSGEVFAEAWHDGTWSNPFGASPRLHILSPGLGFGADFTAVPWPMPIVAIQGGIAVGADPGAPDFKGEVLASMHGGDPTQNMIDASFSGTDLASMLKGVGVTGMAPAIRDVLAGIAIRTGRLSVVPPGPGVRLFGEFYPPGFLIEADLSVERFSGRLFADVSPVGLEVAADMTPIVFPGFGLSGAGGQPGPSLYLLSKQGTVAMSVTGTLDLLGVKRSVDLHMSPGGFSAMVSGEVFGAAKASLEVAGKNPFKKGGLWVKAEMAVDFNDLLKREVTAKIDADLKAKRTSLAQAKTQLETQRAALIEADKRLNAARDAKVLALKRSCEGFRLQDKSRADKAAQRDALSTRIAAHEKRARELTKEIADAEVYAKRTRSTLNPLDCARGEAWDPIHGGGCYACPAGSTRDLAVHIEKRGACLKPITKQQAALVGETAAAKGLRVERDVVQKALDLLVRGIDKVGQGACKTAADATAIDRLPGIKELIGEHRGINALIDSAQAIVSGAEFATVTTADTAKWLAERGGNVAGIMVVREASFEGCVDTVHSGSVAIAIDATFAGRNISGSFRLNFANPAEGAKALAATLLKTGAMPAATNNGTCVRPDVPRVKEGTVVIPDRVTAMRKRPKHPPKKGAKAESPGWAKAGGTARERAARDDKAAGKKPATVKVPQVDPVEMCRRAVQGRVVRDDAGRMAWSDPELDALCMGTSNGDQPGICFEQVFGSRKGLMVRVPDPTAATIAFCGGVSDAKGTLDCLGGKLRTGVQPSVAMKACRGER